MTRKSIVDAVFQRLRDGHLDDLVGILVDLLAGGWVAHHAGGTLAAVDFADTGQRDGTATGHFLGDDTGQQSSRYRLGDLIEGDFRQFFAISGPFRRA